MTANTTIHPDSPFRIGTSGKFKLLIKSVEEKFGDYEYLLIDADEKEYKAIAKALYAEGQILRCMVSFKVERARLVVENVAVCSKQDLATPILIAKKPAPTPTKATAPIATPKAKTKAKTKTKKQGKQKKSNNRAVEKKGIYDSYRMQKAEEALAFLDSIKATDTTPIRKKKNAKKQKEIKTNDSSVDRQISLLTRLIQTQRGKRFSGVFTCAKCFNKHTTGYLFTDENDNEYEVCAYCCREKKDYGYIIYTAMGNG